MHYTNQGMGECLCDWIWTLHIEWLWAKRKGKRWLQNYILSSCQRRDYLENKVRYASDMVFKYSQKVDGEVNNYWNTPYWLSACWTTSGTCVSPTILLMSFSLPKSCSPGRGKVTYLHATMLMLARSLSSSHQIVPQLW